MKKLEELKRQAQKCINSHSLIHLSPCTILALIKAVEALEYYAQGYRSFERINDEPKPTGYLARQALEAIEKQIEKEE